MQPAKTIAAGLFALTLAGCAGDSGPTLGTLTGGIIGTAFRATPGAVVEEAPIGGLIGGPLGSSLDAEDRRRAYLAEMDALENGGPNAPRTWHGNAGYGTIVPGPTYVYGAHPRCRQYNHTIYLEGRPTTARGEACRNSNGIWAPLAVTDPFGWAPR
jgi:surface antigen